MNITPSSYQSTTPIIPLSELRLANISGKFAIPVLSLFCFFHPGFLVGQALTYNVRFLTFEDGLPNRSVTCVAQDTTGVIWIGMSNGLASYDGQEFRVIKDKEGFPFSSYIVSMQPARGNKFRIQTSNGNSFLFSPYTNTPHRYNFQQEIFPNQLSRILGPATVPPSFFIDPANQLFAPDLHTRIDSTDFLTGGYQPTPWGTVLSMNTDAWQATEFDSTGVMVRKIKLPGSRSRIIQPNFFLKGTDQLIYTCSVYPEVHLLEEFLWRLDETGEASPIKLKQNGTPLTVDYLGPNILYRKFILKRDEDNRLWFATKDRLYVFDSQGELIVDLSQQLNQLAGTSWRPFHLFSDSAGNLWLSTNIGLFLISARPALFKTLLKEEQNTSVRSIIELDNDRLLVGTYKKNRIIDLKTGATSPVCPTEECWCFNSLHRMPNGDILAGSDGSSFMSIRKDSIVTFENSLDADPILVPYYHAPSKTYFYGSTAGLYTSAVFDGNLFRFSKHNGFKLIEQATINHFYETPTGLWIGTSKGLFFLHPDEGITRSELNKYHIKHFHVDGDGIFWIATSTTGLLRWNPVTKELRTYTMEEGLTNNTIYAVYQDDDKFFWLPSNKGLMRFDPEFEDVISFQPEDGIAHEEFNTFSHYKASDGTFYFGGLEGLTSFHPSTINLKKNQAPLRITSLSQYVAETDGIEDRTAALLSDGYIQMAPNDKFFVLTFNLLDYTSPGISYAWKVEGVFDDWNYQEENAIRLLGLPYGTHQLRIKARSSGSGWIEQELIIPIIVRRPFYLTLPFLLSLPLLLVLLTFAVFRYRTARLRQKSRQLQQVVAERTEELARKNTELQTTNKTKDQLFTMISHDLRAPLISLRGLVKKVNFLLERDRIPEIRQIGQTVDNAVDRTQKLLDNLLSWAIVQGEGFKYNPEAIKVDELFQEVNDLYCNAANAKSILLAFENSNLEVHVDRRSISTVLRNLVDNAIKFTPVGGSINLTAVSSVNGEFSTLRISDTGIGLLPEQVKSLFSLQNRASTDGTAGEKGTGLGLVLCIDLAKLNGGTLTIETTPGKGSTFSLLLPAYKR